MVAIIEELRTLGFEVEVGQSRGGPLCPPAR